MNMLDCRIEVTVVNLSSVLQNMLLAEYTRQSIFATKPTKLRITNLIN